MELLKQRLANILRHSARDYSWDVLCDKEEKVNIVSTWLWLIGTKENAAKLRLRLEGLKSPPLDPDFGPEPVQCPLTVLYGAELSRIAYAVPRLRPALDAWDNGAVSINDLRRWCLAIERGEYAVEPFSPALLKAFVQESTRAYAKKLAEKERVKRLELLKEKPLSTYKRYKPIDWSVI